MKKLSVFLTLISAILWGTMSLFTRSLGKFGFSPMEIVFFRLTVSVIIMMIVLLIKDKKLFIIKLKDVPFFICYGLFGFFMFNFFYIASIKQNSVTLASALLYTSPVFIALFSFLILKEKIPFYKILCLLGVITGNLLLTAFQPYSVSLLGILLGIGSGISYALYSIFGKIATNKYSSLTVIFYVFLFADLTCLLFVNPVLSVNKCINNGKSVYYILTVSVLLTVLPYLLYTFSLKYVSVTSLGIVCLIEPVVAVITGVVYYNETLNAIEITGIVLILISIVAVNGVKTKKITPHLAE